MQIDLAPKGDERYTHEKKINNKKINKYYILKEIAPLRI